MISFYHHYSIYGPALVAGGILFQKISFPVIFPSFCIHFEVCQYSVRKRIWSVKT